MPNNRKIKSKPYGIREKEELINADTRKQFGTKEKVSDFICTR
jgi:hypothetical protein